MASTGSFIPEDGPIALDFYTNVKNEELYYDDFVDNPNSVNYHKSLDFSNVGSYKDKSLLKKFFGPLIGDDMDAMAFRQFHQTRIYIKSNGTFRGMFRHTKQQKESTFLISANLPTSVNYRIGSDWTSPLSGLGGPMLSTMANLLKSGLSNTEYQEYIPESIYNRFQTVQMWNGSRPLTMSITIPVIDDGSFKGDYTGKQNGVRTNFSEALEFLGTLCLPNKVSRSGEATGADDTASNLGFYTPPPSPIEVTAFWNKQDEKGNWSPTGEYTFRNTNNARILIQLGGMLLIDRCIITGINVNYNNTKALIRHSYSAAENGGKRLDYLTPMIAEVTITFSTIEAITAEDYSRMLWLRTQKDMGKGDVSARKAMSFVGLG